MARSAHAVTQISQIEIVIEETDQMELYTQPIDLNSDTFLGKIS